MIKILLAANKKKEDYIDAVEACGATADAKYLTYGNIDEYDGLILCGGNDIFPRYYHQEINGSKDIDYNRDLAEIKLVEKFLKTGKPILGICRGLQLLNIALNGTLHQDIPNANEHCSFAEHDLVHKVIAEENSFWEETYGKSFYVNSYHHQAIDKLGEGLVATLWSNDKKIIEGIRHISKPYFAVQWHPERTCLKHERPDTVNGLAVFKHFIKLCEEYKTQSTLNNNKNKTTEQKYKNWTCFYCGATNYYPIHKQPNYICSSCGEYNSPYDWRDPSF